MTAEIIKIQRAYSIGKEKCILNCNFVFAIILSFWFIKLAIDLMVDYFHLVVIQYQGISRHKYLRTMAIINNPMC